MKPKTIFQCSSCGYQNPKWLGKCPNCSAWNSFVEQVQKSPEDSAQIQSYSVNQESQAQPDTLENILKKLKQDHQNHIFLFSTPILNNFWGKGLTAGSLTLLAGEPGLGKSTLALQVLRSLYLTPAENKPNLLYVTAEESAFELARRSQRLNIPKEIKVLQANNFEQIEQILETSTSNVVIIDSIQTIFSSQISASPGSISQVSTLASRFLAISKSRNISIILIGHVTKDGQIAGPKTLEHLVDSVLLLEASESPQYRTLSFSKHRFGTTSSLLLMKMEETGLEIVTDPSLALLENLESGVGVSYGLAIDKDLPLIVEIQALVSKPNFGGSFFGRREALGIKAAKLNSILAIAEKYLDLDLKNRDIYIQLTGLPKNLQDESLDLPILLAVLSSVINQSLNDVFKEKKLVFAGRLTFSGNLRNATNLELRENTSKKLGFKYNSQITAQEINQALKVIVKGLD